MIRFVGTSSPIQTTAICLVAMACLFGFGVNKELKRLQQKTKQNPLKTFNEHWWAIAYTLTLPGACVCFALDAGIGFQFVAGSVAGGLLVLIAPLFPSSNEKWVQSAAFGIRGWCVALSMTAAMLQMLYSSILSKQAKGFYYLSLFSFAMAAWQACGLGSFVAWTAHPEYGEFATDKKYMLSTVQFFFILGFASHYLASKVE